MQAPVDKTGAFYLGTVCVKYFASIHHPGYLHPVLIPALDLQGSLSRIT